MIRSCSSTAQWRASRRLRYRKRQVSRIQPCTLRQRQKNTAHRSALMGVTQATMAKLPPGPPVLGYGISRRIQCTPVLPRSEEHTSELQSPCNLVCRLLLEKKNTKHTILAFVSFYATAIIYAPREAALV